MKRKKIKNIKKIVGLLWIILFSFNLLWSEEIKYVDPDLKIKSINPSTPKSGEIMEITFILYNNGNKKGKFYINFTENSAFKLITKDKEKIKVEAKSFKEFKTYFLINNSLISNKYPLIAKVIDENSIKDFTFFIEIKNEPHLKIKQNNYICLIGKNCEINFTLINIGYGNLKNLIINFGFPSKTIYLKELKAQEYKTVVSKIYIPENYEEGMQNLEVEISYLDENNNLKSEILTIPIELKSNVDLQISSLEIIKEDKRDVLKIKIENSGEGTAKSIKLIVSLDNYSKTFYGGSLKEGESLTFYYTIPKNINGYKEVYIKIFWFDNREKQKEFKAKIFIEGTNIKQIKNEKIKIIFLVIVIILTIYGVYKLTKTKNKK